MGEVIVTAPAVVAPATAPEDPTAAATVVDTRAAPQSAVSLSDVLDTVPGVQVRRFGGVGEYSTISIRGYAPGTVQLYLDGVPLSRAQNETVNLAELPIDAVDHVEVYRGTTPLGFLRSGPGGVVNIVTRRPGDTPLTAASMGYGSFNYRKLDAVRAERVGAWDYLGFAHYLGSEGDFLFLNDKGTPLQAGDDTIERRTNNAFNLVDGLARVGWQPSPSARLSFTNEIFDRSGGLAGVGSRQTTRSRLSTLRELAHLTGTLTPDWSWPTTIESGVFTVLESGQLRIPIDELGIGRQDKDTLSLGAGGQVVVRTQVGDHHLPSLLLGGGSEQFETQDRICRRGHPTRTRLQATVAAQDEIVLFGDRVSLVPGIRWEHLDNTFPRDPCDPRPAASGAAATEDLFSPHAGVRVQVQPWLTLLANAGRYQRAPNFGELFGQEGRVQGNPTLRSERGRNVDGGARLTLPPLVAWLRAASLEYTYFDSVIDQLIQLQEKSAGVASPANIGSAHLAGHELGLQATVLDRIRLQTSYTHQTALDSSDPAEDPTNAGKRLPGRPADDLYARVELSWTTTRPLPLGDWASHVWPGRLAYDVSMIGDMFRDRANSSRKFLASRALHGLSLDLDLPVPRLRLALEMKNFTNDHTRDLLDFPLPGRTFYATLSWGFGAQTP